MGSFLLHFNSSLGFSTWEGRLCPPLIVLSGQAPCIDHGLNPGLKFRRIGEELKHLIQGHRRSVQYSNQVIDLGWIRTSAHDRIVKILHILTVCPRPRYVLRTAHKRRRNLIGEVPDLLSRASTLSCSHQPKPEVKPCRVRKPAQNPTVEIIDQVVLRPRRTHADDSCQL